MSEVFYDLRPVFDFEQTVRQGKIHTYGQLRECLEQNNLFGKLANIAIEGAYLENVKPTTYTRTIPPQMDGWQTSSRFEQHDFFTLLKISRERKRHRVLPKEVESVTFVAHAEESQPFYAQISVIAERKSGNLRKNWQHVLDDPLSPADVFSAQDDEETSIFTILSNDTYLQDRTEQDIRFVANILSTYVQSHRWQELLAQQKHPADP